MAAESITCPSRPATRLHYGQAKPLPTDMDRTATFTLNEQDMRQANGLHRWITLRQKRTIISLLLSWLVFVAIFAGYHAVSGMNTSSLIITTAVFAIAAIPAMAIANATIPLAISWYNIRQRFRHDKQLSRPASISWDKDAYEVEQPGIKNHILWKDYMRLSENAKLFVFFLSDYQYQILPKRVLSPEQIADLQQTIAAAR